MLTRPETREQPERTRRRCSRRTAAPHPQTPPPSPLAAAAGPPAPPLVPVGPTMSAAIAAAEERWAAERRGLENEVAWLRKQKLEDARVLQQTASLVQMLQEAHRALVSSNEQLLAQVRRLHTHPTCHRRRERHTWEGGEGCTAGPCVSVRAPLLLLNDDAIPAAHLE